MLHSLIIKGNAVEASAACLARGIHYSELREVDSGRQTVAIVDADTMPLIEWYCERPAVAPFPVGALLLYTERRVQCA